MKSRYLSGFSLIEFAIVLAVIGLLVGGIMTGRDMMHSAQVNSVISDLSKYKSAVYEFKEKYKALPGDMANASTFWPSCDATPSNCNDTQDGMINDTLPWFHLSLAGILDESYPIVTSIPVPGVDVPKSDLNEAGFGLTYGFPYGHLANYFTLSKSRPNGSLQGAANTLDAQAIDRKMDDDSPATGNVYIVNQQDSTPTWQTSGCVDGGDIVSAPSGISWPATQSEDEECLIVYFFD